MDIPQLNALIDARVRKFDDGPEMSQESLINVVNNWGQDGTTFKNFETL